VPEQWKQNNLASEVNKYSPYLQQFMGSVLVLVMFN
jgi:hypothetical protein